MSDVAAPAANAVPESELCWKMRELILDGHEAEALALLKAHPGLARADLKQRQRKYDSHPFIVFAADNGMPVLLKALLDNGSDPLSQGTDFNPVLLSLLEKKTPLTMTRHPFTANSADMIEALLATGRYTEDVLVSGLGRPISTALANMMMDRVDDPTVEQRRRKIFHDIVQRVGVEHFKDGIYMFTNMLAKSGDQQDLTFVARTLIDKGIDTDAEEIFLQPAKLPSNWLKYPAALVAGGYGQDNLAHFIDNQSRGMQPHHIVEADTMLRQELQRVYQNTLKPQKLLLTQEGRPTWQAQGLAARGMIGELFDEKRAQHFGGREAQRDCAMTLHNAYRERFRDALNLPGLLRVETLAQPQDAVTVRYLRGADVTSGKVAA